MWARARASLFQGLRINARRVCSLGASKVTESLTSRGHLSHPRSLRTQTRGQRWYDCPAAELTASSIMSRVYLPLGRGWTLLTACQSLNEASSVE